jgi:hypothetical protein
MNMDNTEKTVADYCKEHRLTGFIFDSRETADRIVKLNNVIK